MAIVASSEKVAAKTPPTRWYRPRLVADAMPPLVKPAFQRRGFTIAPLLLQWASVVGDDLARFSRPQKITFSGKDQKDGVLHVAVPSSFTLDMQYKQPIFLEKINTFFGFKAVKALKIYHEPLSSFPMARQQVRIAPVQQPSDNSVEAVLARLRAVRLQSRKESAVILSAAKNLHAAKDPSLRSG